MTATERQKNRMAYESEKAKAEHHEKRADEDHETMHRYFREGKSSEMIASIHRIMRVNENIATESRKMMKVFRGYGI